MTIIDVAQRRRVGGDDVDVDPQPVGVEPDRVLDALDPVDRVERRDGRGAPSGRRWSIAALPPRSSSSMSDCSTWWPPSSTSTLATSLTSPPAPKLAHTSSIVTPAHPLGAFDRLAHRDLAGFHVGDIAALDPAALALAGAEHAQPPVVVAA